jgi:hypothetical protein
MNSTLIKARLALHTKSQELAEKYAHELDNLGFSNLHATPRGVHFEGTIDLFERTFKCRVTQSADSARFESMPVIPAALEEGIEAVYFPTKPTFFE